MPRTARIHLPGGVFHVISRAIDRRFLLDGHDERRRYLDLLQASLRYTDARVLAWCIMSNHVHLVLRAGEEPLWRLVKAVHVGYANWKNRRDRRIGPVFAERYKSVLVEADAYLLELVRYVHLNPVRAGAVQHAEESTWSSHVAYLDPTRRPLWLDSETVLSHFADEPHPLQAFARFVDEGVDEPRSALLAGDDSKTLARELAASFGSGHRPSDAIVGSEAFVTEVAKRLGMHTKPVRLRTREAAARLRPPVDRLIDLVCEVTGVERELFEDAPRARASRYARYLLTRLWVSEYRARRIELARALKVRPEQVTRWFSRSVDTADLLHDAYQELLAALPRLEARLANEERVLAPLWRDREDEAERSARLSVNLALAEPGFVKTAPTKRKSSKPSPGAREIRD